MKASDLFVKALENEGVEFIFGIPGEETLDLMDSLSRSKIKFIATRHEQGAAFMADVYGRLKGKAGVCLSTLGPGATNLITGVADANLDRAPLVAITGQKELESTYKEFHQYINVVQTFQQITKWNKTITKSEFIPEIVRKAFKIAQTEKFGSTHLELPKDIAVEETNAKPLKINKSKEAKIAGRKEISKAINLVKKSKNPVIIAGNGVIRARACKELLAFARKNTIPVVTTFMGKGAVPANEPLYLGTIGLQAKDYVMCGLDNADLVIAVGKDFVEYAPSKWNPAKNKKIIHIDSAAPEIDAHYETSADLTGNIKETLKVLVKKTKGKRVSRHQLNLKDYMEKEFKKFKNNESFPMKPQKIIYDLRKALKEDDILVADVGAHKIWLSRLYPAQKPNTFIVSNGFASMGISLPGAIAAKLVHPTKKVVAATGDGGFLMNIQELETAKRLGLSFVVVVFNDQRYGVIAWNQIDKFGKTFGTSFFNPDFVKLAESFEAKGFRVKKAKEFYPILKKALAGKGVNVIDVKVDFKENLKLTKTLGHLICPH